MKLLYTPYLLCLFFINNIHYISATQKAVINVPVTDLLGQPIAKIDSHQSTEDAYNAIAFCTNPTNSPHCPRLHQLLYNDIVEIIKEEGNEVCICISHAYYLTPSSLLPQTQYWTLKKNITLLDDLTQQNITIAYIPDPINFCDTNYCAFNQANIVTLIEPHYDSTLRMTFSAGTRFIHIPSSQKKRNSSYTVFAIDYKTLKEHQIKIPLHKCIITDQAKTQADRITNYVDLLKKWAHQKHGCIPYTWGGTSFTHTIPGNFKEVTHKTNNGDYICYEYEKNSLSPKSGFDCSGAIARATQICGIPYFCKNTATISHCLTQLKSDQSLSPGDLILIRGHVMVVSDVTKNLLIEARSYGHGYGKLHEIPLEQVFEDMYTYKDLTDAFFNKTVIKRKDKQGKVRDTFTNLQLFSMASVWHSSRSP